MTAPRAGGSTGDGHAPAHLSTPANEAELEEILSRPTPGVLRTLRQYPGDSLVLGAAGKMGPSLARMLRRALTDLGSSDRVIAVSRFSADGAETALRRDGIETIRCDLADAAALRELPTAPNVFFLAGQKFGTAGSPAVTWGMNVVVPTLVAQRFVDSRIVAFSTGNVYPLTPIARGGSLESDPPAPVGEYAMSCLGRERVFEFHSRRAGTPVALVRLNYAVDLRYGVLVDVAAKVWRGEPVDVRMGFVNVIWQGDATARAIQCLPHAASPPVVVNVTGLETVSIREAAQGFARHFGREALLAGEEAPDALLSNASLSSRLFGPPDVPLGELMRLVGDWVSRGGALLGKPTHFEARDGGF